LSTFLKQMVKSKKNPRMENMIENTSILYIDVTT